MPPVKSLRYFNNDGSRTPWIVAMGLGAEQRAMRRRARQSLRQIIGGQERKWLLRYFFLPSSLSERTDNGLFLGILIK